MINPLVCTQHVLYCTDNPLRLYTTYTLQVLPFCLYTNCTIKVLSLLPELCRYSTYYLYSTGTRPTTCTVQVLNLLPVLLTGTLTITCTVRVLPPSTCTVRILYLLAILYGFSPYNQYCTGTPPTTCTVRVLHQVDHLVLQLALLLLQIHPKLILQNFKLKGKTYQHIQTYLHTK